MAFNKQAPEWGATGIEPPESKRNIGWEVEDRPPAAWLNWFMNLTAESLQELQSKAAEKTFVEDKIAEAIAAIDVDIPDASLTVKGITQLNSAVNSTSETEAATPKAVKSICDSVTAHLADDATLTTKGHVQLSNATNGTREDIAPTEKALGQVMAEAQAGKQAGNERKAEVVAALVAVGIPATTSETWAQLIPKIAAIIRALGNVTAEQVLAGATYSNSLTNKGVGTMPINNVDSKSVSLVGTSVARLYTRPKVGYWDGSAGCYVDEPNFIPTSIRADKNVFGVQGSIPIRRADISTHITSSSASYGAYSVGDPLPYIYFNVPNGHLLEGVEWARRHEPALTPQNVRKGISLFDGQLVGTLVEGKRFATGTAQSPNEGISAWYINGSNAVHRYPLTVTGLSFTPSIVIAYMQQTFSQYTNYALLAGPLVDSVAGAWRSGQTGNAIDSIGNMHSTISDANFRAFAGGFTAPAPSGNGTYGWIAFE